MSNELDRDGVGEEIARVMTEWENETAARILAKNPEFKHIQKTPEGPLLWIFDRSGLTARLTDLFFNLTKSRKRG